MKNLFELEQKVEIVKTMYECKHLLVGCTGVVKEVCMFSGGEQDKFMYELLMDGDETGTWPFFEDEIKAVE